MSSRQVPILLIADDDPDDRAMTIAAISRNNFHVDVRAVEDGEELVDYLNHKGAYSDGKQHPQPSLILLDLNMPRKDGREALAEIKSNRNLCHIPIVVMTTSRDFEDVCTTYKLGVNSFVSKPVTSKELTNLVGEVSKYWFEVVELPGSN